MAAWQTMLGGLFVWAAHFFALYILASVFGTSAAARIGTAAATLLALATLAWLARSLRRHPPPDPLARWMASLGVLALLLAVVAVIWQALPAILIG